jgi:hypothetical protein
MEKAGSTETVDSSLPDYTASHSRRQTSSLKLLYYVTNRIFEYKSFCSGLMNFCLNRNTPFLFALQISVRHTTSVKEKYEDRTE